MDVADFDESLQSKKYVEHGRPPPVVGAPKAAAAAATMMFLTAKSTNRPRSSLIGRRRRLVVVVASSTSEAARTLRHVNGGVTQCLRCCCEYCQYAARTDVVGGGAGTAVATARVWMMLLMGFMLSSRLLLIL